MPSLSRKLHFCAGVSFGVLMLATSLRDVVRSTAGVTLGTGEGGNAFGDRFFIRGFDARNDVFVDGVRDPGVSVRENFFTEQVEILRGPGSTIDGCRDEYDFSLSP